MKRLVLAGLLFSGLFACPGYGPGPCWKYNQENSYMNHSNTPSHIPYLKSHFNEYKSSLNINEKNLEINWVITSSKENLDILKSHIEFMKSMIFSGRTPRKWDRLFVDYAKLRPYMHESIKEENNKLIISQKADNICAFEFAKAHALAVKNDFFNGNTFKDYSSKAVELENLPECRKFF